MNIFYLHSDPVKAAQIQYNKHVVKMILESAQMLCTAHHHYAEELGYDNSYIPYKKAHYNHPSTIWTRQNSRNYYWLYHHMSALGNEYTKRYNKTHLTLSLIHISEPTRHAQISYAVFCLKKKTRPSSPPRAPA